MNENGCGWLKISRAIQRHWLWEDAERLKWWLDLLMLANWEDRKILTRSTHLQIVRRGQLVAGLDTLSLRWGRNKKTILRFLNMLEDDKMIVRETMHGSFPLITICNYERYQVKEEEGVHSPVHSPIAQPMVEKVHSPIYGEKCSKSDTYESGYNTQVHSPIHSPIHSPVHPYKENKEIKNINNQPTKSARTREGEIQEIEKLKANEEWRQAVCMKYKLLPNDLEPLFDEFETDAKVKMKEYSTVREAAAHFDNWLRIKLNNTKNGTDQGRSNANFQRNETSQQARERRARDLAAYLYNYDPGEDEPNPDTI